MGNRSRLLLCRVGFVLLCVVPTVVVGGWVFVRSFDGWGAGKAEWERELTNRLGLVVAIERVAYPRWGLAQLRGIKLLDPETKQTVADASQVEFVAAADGWQVNASGLVIEGSGLGLLAHTIDQRILRGPIAVGGERRTVHVELASRDSLVRMDGRCQTLEQFGGDVEISAEGVKLAIAFRLAGAAPAGEAVRFTAIRDRTQQVPRTQWQLDTRGTPLPCRPASVFVPELARLGPECEFNGVIQMGEMPSGIRGHVAGTLTRVDLDSLVSEQFPHQLSGQAMVGIEQAAVEKGKLAEVRGTVQARQGMISRSLVTAAAEHLGLTADDAALGELELVPYWQMGLGFRLTGQSLALTGSADATLDGVMITSAAGPVLSTPPEHSVAATRLLRTLLPESELQVPAARQTLGLASVLPIPEIVPIPAARPPSHTPTRLAPAVAEPAHTAVRPPVLR